MDEVEISADPARALGTTARLAAAFARPFRTFDETSFGFGSLSPAEIRAFERDPSFTRPIERALAARMLETEFALSADEARKLDCSPEGRLAVLIASDPHERVEEAALLCAAAAMQQYILRIVEKPARQRMRQALGPAAFQVATQEAPVLYPGFAVLGSSRLLADVLSEDEDADAARRRFVNYGLGFLLRIVAKAAPSLISVLTTKRFPHGAPSHKPEKIDEVQTTQFIKLIHRRMPAWSAIIG